MKICPNCNHPNPDPSTYCTTCGADISKAPVQPEPAPVIQTMPVVPIAPPPVPIYEAKPKEPLSWADICGLIGFIASLLGVFWFTIVLMPLGIILSLLGFLGKRFRGMTIAALTISLLGILIKICIVLESTGAVPDWVTQGLFS